jgi:signal transduction histidine kinase
MSCLAGWFRRGPAEARASTQAGMIQLRTALAADLWPALVDPTQIESVILNVAINAREAMPSGCVLTLGTFNVIRRDGPLESAQPAPGQYVGLVVSDTGGGIPNDVLPHVFEPFFTAR